VYSSGWPLSYLSGYAGVVFTVLNYKACSVGLVHFTGKTLSVCFETFLNSDNSDPMGVRTITGGIIARFCGLRLRPESCNSYSRLGGFACKCEV